MSRKLLLKSCKNDLIDIYKHAIDAIKPDILVRNSLNIRDNTLSVIKSSATNCDDEIRIELDETRVHVIGAGKSALGMACGLSRMVECDNKLKSLFSRGTLSVPIGLKSVYNQEMEKSLKTIGTECFFGSENNLPDQGSIIASQHILDNIVKACTEDKLANKKPLFLVLLSGGGSACLTSPKHIDLKKKIHIIKFLVQKGADIIELNKVRRYFSNVKGGQLARYIFSAHQEAKILSLIMSDVIGDSIEFIASGPTFLQDYLNTCDLGQDALHVLTKYDYNDLELLNNLKASHHSILNPTSKERVLINTIVGNNEIALKAGTQKANELGYKVHCIGNDLNGDSSEIVELLCRTGDQLFNESLKKLLIIGGGEAVIKKREGETWGIGGRAQEMAIDYMEAASRQPVGGKKIDYFLAGGTDGQDGPTDVAACLASQSEFLHDMQTGVATFDAKSLNLAKTSHDSNTFWNRYKPDWLIKTGLTGTNVMDLYFYLLSNR